MAIYYILNEQVIYIKRGRPQLRVSPLPFICIRV